MNYFISAYESARADITEAYLWYEGQKVGLGDEFLMAVAECCNRIISYPLSYQLRHKHYRQARLKRFPYVVVYEVIKKEVIVYSVFHTSRNPRRKYSRKPGLPNIP